MKRIFFLLLALPAIAFSQENNSHLIEAKVKQGSVLVGGNISASMYRYRDQASEATTADKGTNIVAVLRAKNGYFIHHDFAVGLDVTLSHESIRRSAEAGGPSRRESFLLAGPFVRYYLDNGIFGEASAGLGLLDFSAGAKNNLWETSVGVGYALFVNEKIAIEPMLNFRYYRETSITRSYASFGPTLGIGIQAYLLRKKSNVIKSGL